MIIKKEMVYTIEIPEQHFKNIVGALELFITDEQYTKVQTYAIEEALKYLR